MQTILPGVHFITGLLAGRIYGLEDPDGLPLVDASGPPAAGRILEQIRGRGRSPRDVKRILAPFNLPNLRLPPGCLTVDTDEDRRSVRQLADWSRTSSASGAAGRWTQAAAGVLRAFATRIGV